MADLGVDPAGLTLTAISVAVPAILATVFYAFVAAAPGGIQCGSGGPRRLLIASRKRKTNHAINNNNHDSKPVEAGDIIEEVIDEEGAAEEPAAEPLEEVVEEVVEEVAESAALEPVVDKRKKKKQHTNKNKAAEVAEEAPVEPTAEVEVQIELPEEEAEVPPVAEVPDAVEVAEVAEVAVAAENPVLEKTKKKKKKKQPGQAFLLAEQFRRGDKDVEEGPVDQDDFAAAVADFAVDHLSNEGDELVSTTTNEKKEKTHEEEEVHIEPTKAETAEADVPHPNCHGRNREPYAGERTQISLSKPSSNSLCAQKEAVEAARVRDDIEIANKHLLEVVERMRDSKFADLPKVSEFMSQYTRMMELVRALQPQGPPSTVAADPAALVALNLLMRVGAGKGNAPEQSCVPTSEPGRTPRRDRDRRRSSSVDGFLRMHAPRSRQYSVINPRTGEQFVINSTVPFSWRHPQRLRILDPRTGAEVLPSRSGRREGPQRVEEASNQEPSEAIGATPRRTSISSRTSMGSTGSAGGSAVKRQQRRSLAGRAVRHGGGWALEPACGGHWDWPLSRQEKKDRILMLGQLELLQEIEDLQDAEYGDEQLK